MDPVVTNHTDWNQTAMYKCNEGYTLVPEEGNKKTCDSMGVWQGDLGECIPSKSFKIKNKILIISDF